MKIADWKVEGLFCSHCGKLMGAENSHATAVATLDHVLVDHFKFTREPNGGWSRESGAEFSDGLPGFVKPNDFTGFVKPEKFSGSKKCKVSKVDAALAIAFHKARNSWYVDKNYVVLYDREV